jgi:hypothetical protein
MKNIFKLIGIIAIVAIIGFSMAACGGDEGDDLQTVTYSGETSDGQFYTLKITENPARYAARIGDDYELTNGSNRSIGKVVDVSGDTLTLKPSNTNASSFTATVSESGLTALNGPITWSNDTQTTVSGTLTGKGSGGGGGGGGGGGSGILAGTTWKCTESYPGVGSITFTLSFTTASRVTLESNMMGISAGTYNGTYTVNGSSINVQWDAGYTGSGSFSVNGNRLTDSEGHVFIKQ